MKTLENIPPLDGVNPELLTRLNRNYERQRRLIGPTAVSSDFAFDAADAVDSLQVDATAGNITITLPPPSGNRRRRVVKTDASANTVTLTAGSNLINGVTSHILSVQYGNITVEPTGTSWLIVGWNTQVIITGGSIDGTPIGAAVPNTGAFTTLSATSQATFSNGSAAAPSVRIGSSEQSGLYRAGATSTGIAAAGNSVMRFFHDGTVPFLVLDTPAAGQAGIYSAVTSGAIYISASTGNASGGQIRLFGSTHATKANTIELTRGGTVIGVFSASGLALTGALSVSSLAGVGTRNVVVDAAGNLSAP